MNILVIGNGFDLAHKLKTKYTDFLDSLDSSIENVWVEFFKWLKDDSTKYLYKSNSKDTWIDFENEITNIIKLLDFPFNQQYIKNTTKGLNDIDKPNKHSIEYTFKKIVLNAIKEEPNKDIKSYLNFLSNYSYSTVLNSQAEANSYIKLCIFIYFFNKIHYKNPITTINAEPESISCMIKDLNKLIRKATAQNIEKIIVK